MSAFQVAVCHKLDSLWKMLLNEDQRMFETKQVTGNYKILTSCSGSRSSYRSAITLC